MTITPSVGRIVHYTNLGDPPEVQPALIVRVLPDNVCKLFVFYPTGTFWCDAPMSRGAEASEGERGCWHWPPRV